MRKVKNYTTSVSAAKSISEIEEILLEAGVTDFMKRADASTRRYIEVMFQIQTADGAVSYRLPVRMGNVATMLADQYNREHSRTKRAPLFFQDQAYDTAWRILRDWVDAQVELIRIGMVRVEEVFLPYMLMGNGRTVYERFLDDGGMKLLMGGEG